MSIFGVSDDSYKKATGKSFSDFVEDWANKAVKSLQDSLDSKTLSNTSKNLRQSMVAMPVEVQGNRFISEITDQGKAPYWKFLNEGVQGIGGKKKIGGSWQNVAPGSPFMFKKDNKPSVKHFTLWANLANLSPFAVRETVWRAGLTPNHFVDEAIDDKFVQDMADDLTKFMSRSIEVDIKTDFEK